MKKIGVWLIGALGSISVTVILGSLLLKKGMSHSTGMVETIELEIQVPQGFPEKYRASLIHSAELCAVKKHLEKPPRFDITTVMVPQK